MGNSISPKPKRDYGSRKDYSLKQHGCPLNEIMNGIFFVGNDEHGMGFNRIASPFGNTRLMKPLDEFHPETGLNYYFADFYCISVGKRHYVLFGVTKSGTVEDVFCQHYLVKIDPLDNHFFNFQPDGTAKCSDIVWVFFFFMDELPINDESASLDFHPERINDLKERNMDHFVRVNKMFRVCHSYLVVI